MPPAMKRPAAAAAAGGAAVKAAKKTNVSQILKGIAAADLPAVSKDLLSDMIGISLGPVKEKRDKYQTKVIEMVEGVFASVEESLQTDIAEAEKFIAEDTQSKEELDGKSAANGQEIQTKTAEVLVKKQELAQVAEAFKAAREAVGEAEVKGMIVEQEANVKSKERVTLVSLREELQGPEEEKASDLVKRLMKLGISETMMVALPAVLSKPQAERGSFDAMVITSISEELNKRIAAADEIIQNVEPSKAAAADALSKAQATLTAAADKQLSAAAAYTTAKGEEEQLQKEAEELSASVRQLKLTARKHNAASSKVKGKLEDFQTGPKKEFESLRDASEAVPEAPAPETAPEAGDEQMATS